jgi:hypothetical protein
MILGGWVLLMSEVPLYGFVGRQAEARPRGVADLIAAYS